MKLILAILLLAHARTKPIDLETLLTSTTQPKDLEVCFSPEEHCDAKLIKFVQSAQSSIDLAIYDINHEQLVHQLLKRSKEIKLRILVDRRQSMGPHSLVSLLIKAGAQIRYGHQRGIMHNKFMVVDNKMVETGSYNYTNHATEANNENQIYLTSNSVVARYHNRFEKIWQEGKPVANAQASSR